MKRQGKKKEQNGSANGDSLQVPENQTVDNDDIPLVLVNNGTESAGTRKRSRAISRVSMSSDDEATKEKQGEEFLGQKSTMLHQLILNGKVEEIRKLLTKGTSVNTRDKSGKTPLHTAILSKQHTIVDMLLNHGADVTVTDDAGDTPLHTAIYVGSERLVLHRA
ncbi:ankyrin repeat domain-containing protein 1-like [Montipora foliosa]|uniref:ankyrin repeat domain-containing protein 1-like n=1 Tax=Montipora foliosa TaxID=591990 RepID=UPI0035F1F573